MSRDWYKEDDAPLSWGERILFAVTALMVGLGYFQMIQGVVRWLTNLF